MIRATDNSSMRAPGGGGSLRASSRHFNRLLLLVSAVLMFGISSLFLIDLRARYLDAIEEAKRSAQSYADILAQHTARTFEGIELTLRAVQSLRASAEADQSTTPDAIKSALQRQRSASPALLAVGWTNVQGDVLAHSYQGAAVRANIADLPHFQAVRDNADTGLFIGSLYRSKASDQFISGVALRLTDAEGRFAGAIAAPLDLSYFARTYKVTQLSSGDSVALAKLDGTLLVREPFVESAASRSFSQTPLFAKRIPESPSGTYENVSPVDGRNRLYGYRVVPNWPLVLIVTQDRADALAAWWRHLQMIGPLVGLLLAIILGGSLFLVRKNNQGVRQTALLEATLESMHEGLIVVDNSNRIAICNRRALRLLDLPAAFMKGNPKSEEVIAFQTAMGEFSTASDDVKTRVQPKLFGETANVYERQRPNGSILEIRTTPFADGGIVRTYKDITAQRRMEHELSRSERQFRLLAENATDIIARLDLKGLLLYISPSCKRILGYTPSEMLHTAVSVYIHPDDFDATVAAFANIVAGRPHGDRIEYRIRHKDGHWLWLEANPTVIVNESGEPVELVDVVRDITERKRIDAEIVAAKAQAEKAAIVKGEFLAVMSHELRTPLNSIVGFSNIILARENLDPELKRQVGLIETASDSLLAIVNDVLDFSKIEEGKLEITPEQFSVSRLVSDSIAIVRLDADTKGLDLQARVDTAIADNFVGDDKRIRQILLNFLNNAIKFTRQGFVWLDVTLMTSTDAAQKLSFSVSDSGVGIPLDRRDRLFKRFSQVDGSISREFGGSGLGLAICRRLVELMGGEIGFDSEIGKGSTFWFSLTLPVAAAQAGEATAVLAMHNRTPRRILLVEDIEINREIATSILGQAGYHVDAVGDGEAAITAARSGAYALILMDVQMPGMDGLAATRAIRNLPSPACEVQIVALTANAMPDQIELFYRAGMNGHIGKPFKPKQLLGTVADHFAVQSSKEMPLESEPDGGIAPHLAELLGSETLNVLLADLSRRLERFLEVPASVARNDLGDHAHRLVSSAGLLGFQSLSEACTQLESALAANQDAAIQLSLAQAETRNVLAKLRVQRAA